VDSPAARSRRTHGTSAGCAIRATGGREDFAMAQRGRPSITKRQKELSRQEKRQEKAARRERRKQEKTDHPEGEAPVSEEGPSTPPIV
jgi:hypothetical protein